MSLLVVISMMQAEKKLISYFRDRKATSYETAIKFDRNEYERSGTSWLRHNIDPSKIPYLKLGDEGKYYLEEQLLSFYEIKNKKIGIAILSFGLIVIIFYLFINNFLR